MAMEAALIDYAERWFGARVLDTSHLTTIQVTERIMSWVKESGHDDIRGGDLSD